VIVSDELRRADTVATALRRGLKVDPISWEQLLAIAQQELGQYQQRRTLEAAATLYDEETASGLIAAARIVEQLANRDTDDLGEEGGHDATERRQSLILASCAYGMYGNFPSAAAVQRSIKLSSLTTEGQWLAIATCNPNQIGNALSFQGITKRGRNFLERLNLFLNTGNTEVRGELIKNFEELMQFSRPISEVVFLRCARLALKHVTILATANLYQEKYGEIFSKFVSKIIQSGRVCLLPPQYNLIYHQNVLSTPENTVITIPTSTGKTLVAEFAIAARCKATGDISVFVAPYVALGKQVYDSVCRHAPDDVDVRGYFGAFNPSVSNFSDNTTIVVATPERFDSILRNQSIISRIKTVVFDESHGIENGDRGARFESLITRMRLQQRRSNNIRIILLSAVLTNVDPVRRWLGPTAVHCHDTWRPTARRLGIWMDDGRLGWLYGADPLRPADRSAAHFIGTKKLPWPHAIHPAETFQGKQSQQAAAFQNAAFLARYLEASLGGPVLIACATKAHTRGVAAAIAAELPNSSQPSNDRDQLVRLVAGDFPHLASLARMLKKGVSYHNAALPSEVKSAIEEAIRSRAIKYVAATTTLAEGVDLPFRVTVLFDWLVGLTGQQTPMSPLLFRNIAGRCGRAGEFTEGDTIIFDNMLGDLVHTRDANRRGAQASLLSDPPSLKSVIGSDELSGDVKSAVYATVSSQFMASIPENPDVSALEDAWSKSTYAAFASTYPVGLFQEIRNDVLSDAHGWQFAKAASPLHLTPLGVAANRTGFSPQTCRDIIMYLREGHIEGPVPEFCSQILVIFGNCSEQTNYILRDIAIKKRTTFYVKADDLVGLTEEWLKGTPLTEMFLTLPRAIKSRAAVSPLQWVRGEANHEPIAAQYDKFVEFVEYTFGSFLPWILRSIGTLAPFVQQSAADVSWNEIAKTFETARIVDDIAFDTLTHGD